MARRLTSLLLVSLGAMRICQVYAQDVFTTTATCVAGMEWLNNAAGQSPCMMLAASLSACVGPITLPPWNGSDGIYNVFPPYATPDCGCSDIVYNLIQACVYCQQGAWTGALHSSEQWSSQCDSRGAYDAGLPGNKFTVPIPYWAQIVPNLVPSNDLVNNNFNPDLVRRVAALGIPDATDDLSVRRLTMFTSGTSTGFIQAGLSTSAVTPSTTSTLQPSTTAPSVTTSQNALPLTVTSTISRNTVEEVADKSVATEMPQAIQSPIVIVPIGMIIGGIVGGLVLLIIALAVYWWYLRRKQPSGTRALDMEASSDENGTHSRRRAAVASFQQAITPYTLYDERPTTNYIPLTIIPPCQYKKAPVSPTPTFRPGHHPGYSFSRESGYSSSSASKLGSISDRSTLSPLSEQGSRQIRPSVLLEQQNIIIEQLQMLREQMENQRRSPSNSSGDHTRSSSGLRRKFTPPPPKYS